ncbi:MAG: Carboxypeptidase Taq [Candidatus Saccharibacteria bacterium]|nr:Carboxypeptidase Taq [Candidatus Saccharibacteria bacterium]
MTEIQTLRARLQSLTKLGSALALMSWDEEVNLPERAHEYRGEVNAQLSSELHERITSDELTSLVNKLADPEVFNSLTDDEKVIVRETKRDIDQAKKLPTEFVERMARLTTKAFSAWVEARKKSDFKIYEPVLGEILKMKIEEARLLGYKDSPYDALLDEFEPDMTVQKIDAVFKPLAASLAELIGSVRGSVPSLPARQYPLDKQVILNQKIAAALGYDLHTGRIDISPHPFTISLHPTDVRITTRYDSNDFWGALGSTIHETGHALYEQGLPASEHGTPLGEAGSLGIHESQSRTWENFVGRSRPFTSFLYPQLAEHFGAQKFSEEELYLWLNRVQPNPIRVESDEVTYNLHIIIRYELEKDLIEGNLAVADLPAAWNAKVKLYLGLDIKNDAEGVLQDVHWSHGAFGYFPTYTLGNLYAAQLFATARKALPTMDEDFAKGKFKGLLGWQRENIHRHGRRYHADELIERVTGEKLSSEYLLEHLAAKVKLNY